MPRQPASRPPANQPIDAERAIRAASASGEPSGQHWFGAEGVTTIQTASYLEARLAAEYAAHDLVMCLIYGEAGLGKSYATRHAVQPHTDRGLPVVWVEYRPRTRMKGIAQTLVTAIAGYVPEGDRRHVEPDLLELLAEEDRLIVIDETQRLSHEALEYLRYLHDHPRSRFGLLLVGGHGCWEVISRYPMLESRILIRVEFSPFTAKETTEVIPRYHAIYAGADLDLLRQVHRECTHGVFRSWAAFTRLAADTCARLGIETLNRQVVDVTFRQLGVGRSR